MMIHYLVIDLFITRIEVLFVFDSHKIIHHSTYCCFLYLTRFLKTQDFLQKVFLLSMNLLLSSLLMLNWWYFGHKTRIILMDFCKIYYKNWLLSTNLFYWYFFVMLFDYYFFKFFTINFSMQFLVRYFVDWFWLFFLFMVS